MTIDMAEYMANRRTERRNKLVGLAGGKCSKCGATENLEFNHLDRSQRLFVLSGAGLDKAWSKILVELDKCELVCSACHRKYTNQQYATKEIRQWNDKTDLPYEHGTVRMYQEKKCKCGACKLAKSMYRNKEIKYDQKI